MGRGGLRSVAGPALACIVALGACDGLLTVERPDEIRVVVEGDVADEVEVVTSHVFLVGAPTGQPGGEVQLLVADTALIALPFDRMYDFGPSFRFVVRVSVPSGGSGEVTLRVFLDGKEVWYEVQVMQDGNHLQFYMVQQQ